MSDSDQVIVDKAYFDALLRRADFVRYNYPSGHTPALSLPRRTDMFLKHTSSQLLGRADPTNVTISRAEYDSLLRRSRELGLLKNALFQGGLSADTVAVLTSGAADKAQPDTRSWADDFRDDRLPAYGLPQLHVNEGNEMLWNMASNGQRNTSHGTTDRAVTSSFPEDATFDGVTSSSNIDMEPRNGGLVPRTLYFCNLPPRTTYEELVSVIKGGKLLSLFMMSGKSATVTFVDAAADYLAWAKRNDLYILSKRIDVRWAERQFNLNGHISNRIANGATRNLLIRSAAEKGLTEAQIRDDMEHIHNLVIISIVFRLGDAHVSTNSIHNALFARTCMMSRTAYKGCKIEFYPDECDVPLPTRVRVSKTQPPAPVKKHVLLANRFNMLHMEDGDDSDGDGENKDPLESRAGDPDDDEDDITVNIKSRHGVRLDFLESESTA